MKGGRRVKCKRWHTIKRYRIVPVTLMILFCFTECLAQSRRSGQIEIKCGNFGFYTFRKYKYRLNDLTNWNGKMTGNIGTSYWFDSSMAIGVEYHHLFKYLKDVPHFTVGTYDGLGGRFFSLNFYRRSYDRNNNSTGLITDSHAGLSYLSGIGEYFVYDWYYHEPKIQVNKYKSIGLNIGTIVKYHFTKYVGLHTSFTLFYFPFNKVTLSESLQSKYPYYKPNRVFILNSFGVNIDF